MKTVALLVALLGMAACASAPEKKPPAADAAAPIIVLSPKPSPAATPKCPDQPNEHVRAERWKAYARKLEGLLGISPESEQ